MLFRGVFNDLTAVLFRGAFIDLTAVLFRDAIIYEVGSLGKLSQSLQQLHPDKQKSLPMQLLPDRIAATCETGGSVRAKAHNKKSLPKQTFQKINTYLQN